jgi:hypothetical protein
MRLAMKCAKSNGGYKPVYPIPSPTQAFTKEQNLLKCSAVKTIFEKFIWHFSLPLPAAKPMFKLIDALQHHYQARRVRFCACHARSYGIDIKARARPVH